MKTWSTIGLVAAAIGLAAPSAIAGTAFVPLGSANTILVIDTATDTIIEAIEGVEQVHGLGGTPGSPYLVAGSFAEGAPGEASLGPAPEGMTEEEHAAHHAPSSEPLEEGSAATPVSILSVLRADDGALVRRLEVPGAVHHVALSPDGRYAVATHTGSGGISVTDLESFAVSDLIPTGALPNYVVFSTDGSLAYISNAGDGTVSEVATHSWHVRRTMDAGDLPEHLVLAQDDRTLYVANVEAGTVSVLDLELGGVVDTLMIGGEVHGLDLSEDGNTLFVSGKGEDKLVAVDLATRKTRAVPLGPAPYHLAVIRGEGRLYVSSRDEPKMWVVDQATLTISGVIPIRGEGHQMVVFD